MKRFFLFPFCFLIFSVFCVADELVPESLDYFEEQLEDQFEAQLEDHNQQVHGLDFVDRLEQTSGYVRNPLISEDVWEKLTPYFLPRRHPIRSKLDSLFKKRISLSSKTLKDAGFLSPKARPHSHLVCSKHPKLEGYLLKIYTDDYPEVDEWKLLMKRINGLIATKASIKRHGYEKMLTVPRKWIYPLPEKAVPPEGYFRKYFILVVEDMNIEKKRDNYALWKGPALTKARMDAIYTVINEVGLCDCVYPFNVPFCKYSMKLAFIDTEDNQCGPVNFRILLKYLRPEMQTYLQELINNGGPR